MLLHEAVLELGPQRHDGGEIDFIEGGEVRGLLLRGQQTRGDLLAQRGHLAARGALARRLRGRLGRLRRFALGRGEDVALEDAAILAGALDGGGIDALLGGLVADGGGKIVGVLAAGGGSDRRGGFHTRGLGGAVAASFFFGSSLAAASAGAAAFSSMLATTCPIWTVSPAFTRCLSWPALSATTSDVTLSVSISNSGSPALT